MLEQLQNQERVQLAISEIQGEIKKFVQRDRVNRGRCHEVLNAFPGHGKTMALKQLLKEIVESRNTDVGALVVLREKEQLREFESFIGKDYSLYVDSENLFTVREQILTAQVVLITHERLKNITLLNPKMNDFTTWGLSKRIIFIDEAPIFSKSHVFKLNSKLDWLDDCFKVLGDQISAGEIVIIRSLVQIAIAKELLENDTLQTQALSKHLDSEIYQREMKRFMRMVEAHVHEIGSIDSLNTFLFFKQMFEQDGVGFMNPALHSINHLNHKTIICSDRIDYRILGCSILIFDGTFSYSKTLYNEEYQEKIVIANKINYERLHLYHRLIKTTASRRKAKIKLPVHQIIATDLKNIAENQGFKPFPLMNKGEIPVYRELEVIDEEMYKQYFKKVKDEKNPINILNTVGKNYLREVSALYLVSLPNRPPEYYKEIAVSLYKKETPVLNLSTAPKDKADSNSWFADERIERIYYEVLLSELSQIIHRTSIRNIASEEDVHIYIATKSTAIITKLREMFEGHRFDNKMFEEDLLFESEAAVKAEYLANRMRSQNIMKPTSIGRIEEKHEVKNFVNPAWRDPIRREVIKDVFERYGIKITVRENGEKRVEWKQ